MKIQPSQSLRNAIQVLVFQDGLSSRNFEVPLTWIARLGWYIGGSLLVTILSVGMTFHFWRQSHRAQPERLRELEQQIQLLGATRATVPAAVAPPAPVATHAPALTPIVCAQPPAPVPVIAAQPAPPSPPPCAPVAVPKVAPVASLSAPASVAFRAFPSNITGEVPLVARPSIPLDLSSPLIQWQGRKLKLQFDIRFTGEEGRNQQGRIIVLARGPEAVLAYPSGALRGIDSPHLLDPERGEFFSVSRFRQTKVEFPSVDASIQSLEILLFGADPIEGQQKLLIREILKVPSARGGVVRENSEEE